MGGQQHITGHLRSHLAIAQDEVGEDRAHGAARGALDPPDGDPTQADAHIMRVAGQTPSPITGRLVLELKTKGQDEGEDTFEERLPIIQQLKIGRFILKIDGDRAVFPGLFGTLPHVSLQRVRSWKLRHTMEGTHWNFKRIVTGSGIYHGIRWNVEKVVHGSEALALAGQVHRVIASS